MLRECHRAASTLDIHQGTLLTSNHPLLVVPNQDEVEGILHGISLISHGAFAFSVLQAALEARLDL